MQQFLLPGVLTRSCLTINLFWLVKCCGFACNIDKQPKFSSKNQGIEAVQSVVSDVALHVCSLVQDLLRSELTHSHTKAAIATMGPCTCSCCCLPKSC